jgi:superfamily II DNA or RNA helicase
MMSAKLSYGLYDTLLDLSLQKLLQENPELRVVLKKLDESEQPARYAAFIAGLLKQALLHEKDPAGRHELCNRVIDLLAADPEQDFLRQHRLVEPPRSLLYEITPPYLASSGLSRPQTSMVESSLFTGAPAEPQLVHELLQEMASADQVDILISFIKWSGLRLLLPGFEELRQREVPVRVLTTSYMGASDAPAVEWLAHLPNVEVKISYDTQRTRLHAKAYHFQRHSGLSTAYIGSANISQAAMTSGLEWNLKVTAQDLPQILEKFRAEFDTYWNSREFSPFDPARPGKLRGALARARNPRAGSTVFFDLVPHPFQERILEALERERRIRGEYRNLVIAATGTGKTMIAAFDYRRFRAARKKPARLLFIAHRREILEQALETFRQVLKEADFGELLVGSCEAERYDHLFCSVGMLQSRCLWKRVGSEFYDYIVVDEVHHGTAASYRPIFEHFRPAILLGLTATPERMDGGNVAADFGHRFAAEIRLPEALEEKLLCPFHYFGIADPVDITADRFWKRGRYVESELEKVYTGAHVLARQRLEVILSALERYEPDCRSIKGVGYCVSIRHAGFMAEMFNRRGIPSAAFVSGIGDEENRVQLSRLRSGKLNFLFTVDKFSEGIDVPELNLVMFLRPTQSLTVFLQQLGRGLRHAPGKECLTVLDFVGQVHQRYRMDSRLKALLPRHRFAIEREVEEQFPHLPAGCSIQFDRLSRSYVLANIRANLRRLATRVPELLQTFTAETGRRLTFADFVRHHDFEPERLLVAESWSTWKAKAGLRQPPVDPDLKRLKKALVRAAFISGPREILRLRRVVEQLAAGQIDNAVASADTQGLALHYRIWAESGRRLGMSSLRDSFARLARNPSILADLLEILDWAGAETRVGGLKPELPFPSPLELHANYSIVDIQAALGRLSLESAGQKGIGVLSFADLKAYALLVTFQKSEKEFSPSTMYADYPVSRELLHWESQSTTSQASPTGQNLIQHRQRGYSILIFARDVKTRNGCTVPFVFLGPAELVRHERERPIRIVWRLRHAMPVEMFEANRRGG